MFDTSIDLSEISVDKRLWSVFQVNKYETLAKRVNMAKTAMRSPVIFMTLSLSSSSKSLQNVNNLISCSYVSSDSCYDSAQFQDSGQDARS